MTIKDINIYRQITDNLNVETVLKQMLLEHLGIQYKISQIYSYISNDINKINIGICVPSVFGFEALGATLIKSQDEIKNLNIYFFLPFKGNILINESDGVVYLIKGCKIKNREKIQPVICKIPLLFNKVFFPAYKTVEEPFNFPEVYELTLNKRKTYLFLKAWDISSTDWQLYIENKIELRKEISKLINKENEQIVVKNILGYAGLGIRMFSSNEKEKIFSFCLKTFNDEHGLIIEKRILSYPIIINQIRTDWNVRVIVVFDLNNCIC